MVISEIELNNRKILKISLENVNGINFKPGKLHVCCGDTHVYKTHRTSSFKLLKRKPKPYPKLLVNCKKDNITDFQWEDVKLIGYNPEPNIKVNMAI